MLNWRPEWKGEVLPEADKGCVHRRRDFITEDGTCHYLRAQRSVRPKTPSQKVTIKVVFYHKEFTHYLLISSSEGNKASNLPHQIELKKIFLKNHILFVFVSSGSHSTQHLKGASIKGFGDVPYAHSVPPAHVPPRAWVWRVWALLPHLTQLRERERKLRSFVKGFGQMSLAHTAKRKSKAQQYILWKEKWTWVVQELLSWATSSENSRACFESFILYDFCCRGLCGVAERKAAGLDPVSQLLKVSRSADEFHQARCPSATAIDMPHSWVINNQNYYGVSWAPQKIGWRANFPGLWMWPYAWR